MLTDDPAKKNKRSLPRRPNNSLTNRHWSDSQKLEAVQTYLMLGTVRMTSAALKIPEITIKVWRQSAWWKDLEAELRVQDELQLSTRLKKIAEKSFSAVEDRLDHGNYIFDQKTSQLRRVPVNAKDAHKIALDSVKQKDLIGQRNVERANDGQIIDKLNALANKFAEIAQGTYQKNRTVDVDIEDVEIVEQGSESLPTYSIEETP